MNMLIVGVVSFCSGLLGSLGMGAGAVLLLYLRIWGGFEQLEAQGVNLIFFLPIALLSIWIHARSHLIAWKTAGLYILFGLPAALAGVAIASRMHANLLSKLFAGMLFVIGVRELFYGFGGKITNSEESVAQNKKDER